MSVTIENLTTRPVLLTLTSGQTLRLGPAEISPALADVEVKNNPKVEKLQENRIIALQSLAQNQGNEKIEAEKAPAESSETALNQKAKKPK